MSESEPEPSLIPPDEPPELPWTDWSVAAWISVSARTAEEAQERVEKTVAAVNEFLGDFRVYDAIVQRADDDPPREA